MAWLLVDISDARDARCVGAVFCELWLISGVAGVAQVVKKLRQQAAVQLRHKSNAQSVCHAGVI
jgi:hypothetical protein